jgi:hypothetical protein
MLLSRASTNKQTKEQTNNNTKRKTSNKIVKQNIVKTKRNLTEPTLYVAVSRLSITKQYV